MMYIIELTYGMRALIVAEGIIERSAVGAVMVALSILGNT